MKTTTVNNQFSKIDLSVDQRDAETDVPNSTSKYSQNYTILIIGNEEIWMLPGEARNLAKILRS